MFVSEDSASIAQNFDQRLVSYKNLHAHLSPTCRFSLGLNADDRRFSAEDLAREIEPIIRRGAIQIDTPNISIIPHLEQDALPDPAIIRSSKLPDGLPQIGGPESNTYYEYLAQYNCEMLSLFDAEPDFEINSDLEDELTPPKTPIDYLIGDTPQYPAMCPLMARIDSFDKPNWTLSANSRSRLNSEALQPESFAQAGFFYSGHLDHSKHSDSVTCFWCGLTAHSWEASDIPMIEHIRLRPRCPWLQRVLGRAGRHNVKSRYLNERWRLQQQRLPSNVFSFLAITDNEFSREIAQIYISGILECNAIIIVCTDHIIIRVAKN